jgi:peroxiredoxin
VHPVLGSRERIAPARVPARAPSRAQSLCAAVVVGLCLLASGCASDSGNTNSTDVDGQGYQSGDGSLRTWAQSERGDVVSLSGTDFSGNAVDSRSFGDDVVVLNTWYAACPPCRAEAADLVSVATEHADGVQFIGINGTDDAGAALAFEREHNVSWPSIADTNGSVIATLQDVVPIRAVPTTVVLDKEGRVAARVLGQIDATTLSGLIDDVLAENAGA